MSSNPVLIPELIEFVRRIAEQEDLLEQPPQTLIIAAVPAAYRAIQRDAARLVARMHQHGQGDLGESQ